MNTDRQAMRERLRAYRERVGCPGEYLDDIQIMDFAESEVTRVLQPRGIDVEGLAKALALHMGYGDWSRLPEEFKPYWRAMAKYAIDYIRTGGDR